MKRAFKTSLILIAMGLMGLVAAEPDWQIVYAVMAMAGCTILTAIVITFNYNNNNV